MGPAVSKLKALAGRLYRSWATRSLAVGAGATAVDVTIGTVLASGFHVQTRVAAMAALAVGTTINFLGHRYIAFREKNAKVADPAMRWVAMTLVQTVLHGQIMVMMRDWWGVPFVPAKFLADILVFTGVQLLLVRYVVFRKATSSPSE
jgi:putative flippase GtrA